MNEQIIIGLFLIWLSVGLLMGELTSKKYCPLAYVFLVTLWPVFLPLAVGLAVVIHLRRTTDR